VDQCGFGPPDRKPGPLPACATPAIDALGRPPGHLYTLGGRCHAGADL